MRAPRRKPGPIASSYTQNPLSGEELIKLFTIGFLAAGLAASAPSRAADAPGSWPAPPANLAREVSSCKVVPAIEAVIDTLTAARLIDPKPMLDKHEERIYRLAAPLVVDGGVTFDRVAFYGTDDSELAFAGFQSPSKPRAVIGALKAAGLRSQAKSKSGPSLATTTTMDGKGTYWICGQG